MAEAIASARAESEVRKNSGFNQMALDEAARQGFAAGAFEESDEDGAAVVEEFYPEEFDSGFEGQSAGQSAGYSSQGHSDGGRMAGTNGTPPNGIKVGLTDKLNQKAVLMNGHGATVALNSLSRQAPNGRG